MITARLELRNWTDADLRAIAAGPAEMERVSGASVPENWTSWPETMREFAAKLVTEPGREWWTYFVIHREHRRVIGTCGFKGPPSHAGVVELGYEIHPSYRGQGLATETAQALKAFAFGHPQVRCLRAHTIALDNESTSVLKKTGFSLIGTVLNPEDGQVWQWELRR